MLEDSPELAFIQSLPGMTPIGQSGMLRPWKSPLPASNSGPTPRRARKRFLIKRDRPFPYFASAINCLSTKGRIPPWR
jgi:hypothetical protein